MDIVKACKCGDVEACRNIYSLNSTALAVSPGQLSPLHWLMLGQSTSDEDCVSIIRILEGFGINHSADDLVIGGTTHIDKLSRVTPLHLAVLYKGLPVVNELLRMGSDVDQCDSKGETPLMYSCRGGHIDKATVLIQNGADPSFINASGESAYSMSSLDEIRQIITTRLNSKLLRLSASGATAERVDNLLTVRANVNCLDSAGNSPFSLAIRTGNHPLVLKFLEIDGLNVSQSFPLHDIISSKFNRIEKEEIIHELIFRRIDLNCKDSEGKTALQLCDESQQQNLLRILKENGAVDSESKPPTTQDPPLSPSSASIPEEPMSPSASSLVTRGQRITETVVDIGDISKRIGALFAELCGSRESVDNLEQLASARGSPSIASTHSAPLNMVTESDLVALKLELLNKLNMYLTEFEKAKTVRNKDFKAIGNFIELQNMIASTRSEISAVNERISSRDFIIPDESRSLPSDGDGSAPPAHGGWFRSPESIEADIDACMRQIRKSSGSLRNLEPAILEVVSRCQSSSVIPVLKLLRNRGADVNFKDSESGMTSLMIACRAGSEELVDWLINSNPSVELTCANIRTGQTALHFAVLSGSRRICELLASKGKLPLMCIQDKNGKSAKDLCNNPSIMRILACEPVQSS